MDDQTNGQEGEKVSCERLLYVIDEMIAASVHEMEQQDEDSKEWHFWNGSGNALLQLRSFVEKECG